MIVPPLRVFLYLRVSPLRFLGISWCSKRSAARAEVEVEKAKHGMRFRSVGIEPHRHDEFLGCGFKSFAVTRRKLGSLHAAEPTNGVTHNATQKYPTEGKTYSSR